MTDSARLRIALVGTGAIAEELHIPACLAARDIELVALVDSSAARAQQMGRHFEIARTATDLEAVADDVDAVVLATPPHTHLQLTRQACGLGLHVLCEKPLANTVRECDLMCEAAAANNCILATAHVYRFWPSRSTLREHLQSGKWGQVQSVRVSQGQPYSWGAATGYSVRKELVSGGVLINAGIHPLDSLLWWFGDPLAIDYRDDALGGLESNVRLRMEFPGGISCRFRQSRTCNLKHEIRIDTDNVLIDLPTHDRAGYFIEAQGQRTRIECGPGDLSHLQPGINQLEDFGRAILNNDGPRVSGVEGSRVISLIESCYNAKRMRGLPKHVPFPGATC